MAARFRYQSESSHRGTKQTSARIEFPTHIVQLFVLLTNFVSNIDSELKEERKTSVMNPSGVERTFGKVGKEGV